MEKSSLILFEALDFGLHVLEAGLFGGEGRFFGFWCLDGCLFGHLDGCFGGDFGFRDGWFGFAGCVVWGEALGL